MKTILFWSLFLLQAIPIQKTGTIVGVLRNEDGKPAVGVRVTAMPQLDSLQSDTGPTMSSLAETDQQGRFTLEDVPPGRYYIAAGRLDLPTYYPGTQSLVLGRTVQVTPGATVGNVEFVLSAASAGRADPVFGNSAVTLLDLGVAVTVDGGGKLPVFSNGQFTTITLKGANNTVTIPILTNRASLTPPLTDYTVAVEGLPDGYTLKSVKYGSVELTDRVFRASSLVPNAAISATALRVAFSPAGQVLSIVLDSNGARRQAAGHAVSGRTNSTIPRAVYLSDTAGTVFSDGTFEFRNVQPGRHILMTRDNTVTSPALAAVIVVTNEDIDNVPLQPTLVLPRDVRTVTPRSATASSGVVPLHSLHGKIVDAETGMSVTAGTVYLVGESWVPLQLGAEGRFDVENLLPGTYQIEVQAIGYPTLRREIVVSEQDVELELKTG